MSHAFVSRRCDEVRRSEMNDRRRGLRLKAAKSSALPRKRDIKGATDRDVLVVGLVCGGEDLRQALFGNHLNVPLRRGGAGESRRASTWRSSA
jgi:hypothetical protein